MAAVRASKVLLGRHRLSQILTWPVSTPYLPQRTFPKVQIGLPQPGRGFGIKRWTLLPVGRRFGNPIVARWTPPGPSQLGDRHASRVSTSGRQASRNRNAAGRRARPRRSRFPRRLSIGQVLVVELEEIGKLLFGTLLFAVTESRGRGLLAWIGLPFVLSALAGLLAAAQDLGPFAVALWSAFGAGWVWLGLVASTETMRPSARAVLRASPSHGR